MLFIRDMTIDAERFGVCTDKREISELMVERGLVEFDDDRIASLMIRVAACTRVIGDLRRKSMKPS